MSAVLDFSRWNTLEWWQVAGYASREAAWADFAREQRRYAPEAFANAEAVQARVTAINRSER